jgi:hypothetical protein
VTPRGFFPLPTPEGVRDFVVSMATGGIEMGRVISEAVFVFIESLFVGLA